jgi:hypothetical protein
MQGFPKTSKRNFRSVFNFIWNEKPLTEDQMETFYEREDFISIGNGKQNDRYDDAFELLFKKWPGILKVYLAFG